MLARLGQLWPLELRTGSERILIVMILIVQVENWKSRSPDNASRGVASGKGFLVSSYFFLFFSSAFPAIFLTRSLCRGEYCYCAVDDLVNGTILKTYGKPIQELISTIVITVKSHTPCGSRNHDQPARPDNRPVIFGELFLCKLDDLK